MLSAGEIVRNKEGTWETQSRLVFPAFLAAWNASSVLGFRIKLPKRALQRSIVPSSTTALDAEQELPDTLENNSSIDESTRRWNDKEKETALRGSYLLES